MFPNSPMGAVRLPESKSHNFARVPSVDMPRSVFDRSTTCKTTFDAGYLIPFFVDEILPGDTCELSLNAIVRLNTPIYPIMDNLFFDTFFFFVPWRLLWDNWQRFMGERDSPADSIDYLIPNIDVPTGGWADSTLATYFGLPPGVDFDDEFICAGPFRAYNRIFNEWFRSQDLQNLVAYDLDDGPDDPANYVLLRRCKRHDYFTSCLPSPQKGDAVDLPLGTSAPVSLTSTPYSEMILRTTAGAVAGTSLHLQTEATNGYLEHTSGTNLILDLNGNYIADLSTATAATINTLRYAFQIQRLLERDARGGTRYIEQLFSHFGVTVPDFRLQRSEYLGGGSSIINVTPVAQTSSTDVTSPQGNLSAVAFTVPQGHGFRKSFVEHGFLIGICNVRSSLTYQQGIRRMWTRRTRYDHYYPVLAHLGEQAVLSKEIYVDGTAADQNVFGYQPRWDEYRYFPGMVTGKMNSGATGPLDSWHLALDFASRPTLNATFIQDDPPVDRVIAVEDQPHFFMDAYIRYMHTRVMPTDSIPGMIDHF